MMKRLFLCAMLSLLATGAFEADAQMSVEVAYPNLTFERPTAIVTPPLPGGLVAVVEQGGTIRMFQDNPAAASPQTFLDISDRVSRDGNEEGLLGMVFHPDIQSNPYIYVYYSAAGPRRSVLSRFEFNPATGVADPSSEMILLEVDQPFGNHNAGHISFGPNDGYLYLPLGDDGSAGDPNENAQDRSTLLGSVLRIDVDNPDDGMNYGIPDDNPYVGNTEGWREEIYAYGFRNPFQHSWDSQTGWMWIGDVGQDAIEEIDVLRRGGNFGWDITEGSGCFEPPIRCDDTVAELGITLPIWDYTHNLGETVIGGMVYRGTQFPSLQGHYIFGDFITGRIWALEYDMSDTSAVATDEIIDTDLLITTFGTDTEGEVLIGGFDGKIYRLNGSLATIDPPTIDPRIAFTNLTFPERPVAIESTPGAPSYLFVVEQHGVIHRVDRIANTSQTETFLDITGQVSRDGNEEGLLGLAFHPDFPNTPYFYVYYSAADPRRSVLSRYEIDDDGSIQGDESSELVLLEVPQPFGNHNAGQISFGPDGYLYVPLGDGGSAGDPNENAQDRTTLLGSILRLDVDNPDAGMNYGIPSDNPYVGNTDGWREEIWAYGFRNPFRHSWDPVTGWLWVGDVGQDAIEEVDVVFAGGNYGWDITEGSGCFEPSIRCDDTVEALGITLPIWDYTHREGGTIIGGYVYRGTALPNLAGRYIYADFLSGRFWALSFNPADTSAVINVELADTELMPLTFGTDVNGELFFGTLDGRVYSLADVLQTESVERRLELDGIAVSTQPNPFFESTSVVYDIPRSADVLLEIYDMRGNRVSTLVDRQQSGGAHQVNWDGTSDDGTVMPSGAYICRLSVDGVAAAAAQLALSR